MRVAMIGQYPLDERRILGGIEATIVPLVHSLATLPDIEMHVVTCQPYVEDEERRTKSGLPLHVRQRRPHGRLTFHARDVSSIQRALQDISPDIVHAQGIGLYSLAAVGSPYAHVASMHGIVFREAQLAKGLAAHMRGAIDSFYEKSALAKMKNLIATSPYCEQELPHIGTFRGRLFVMDNPADERFFALEGDGEASTILYPGRVIARKGLLNLLQALVEVRKVVPEVTLRVAGETDSEPEYYATCRQFVAQQGLDHAVSFLGSVTVEQITQEYARCALLALPSKQETAPLVISEAMAAGRPIVTTNTCGMPYLVEDGQSGFLLGYEDTPGWIQALTRITTDPVLRRAMGRRSREMAIERFHPTAVAQRTRAVYVEMLTGTPSGLRRTWGGGGS